MATKVLPDQQEGVICLFLRDGTRLYHEFKSQDVALYRAQLYARALHNTELRPDYTAVFLRHGEEWETIGCYFDLPKSDVPKPRKSLKKYMED